MKNVFSFASIKVQQHLFTQLLLFVSCFVFVLGILLIFDSSCKAEKRYQEQIEQENIRVKSVLLDLTTDLYNCSEDFVMSDELNALLYKKYSVSEEARQNIDSYDKITDLLEQNTSIAQIMIYTNNKTIGNYRYFTYCDESIREENWYQRLASTESSLYITEKAPANNINDYQFCLYKKLPLPLTNDFAIIKIVVSNNYLNNRLNNSYIASIAASNSDIAFYNSGTLLSEEEMPYNRENTEKYINCSEMLTIQGEKCITTLSTLVPYRSDDCIYIFTYSHTAYEEICAQALSYLRLVLFSLLIPCFFLFIYTGYFSARIETLRTAMHRACHEEYDIIDSYAGKDELTETFQGLIMLINSIKKQEKEIYQSKMREQLLINRQQAIENQQRQIEFRILSSQINPHFLYNTLETIRMKALNEGNPEVAKSIKLLGRYLHYSLENIGKDSASLARELEYMQMYLEIQKMRFKARVNYQIELTDEIKKCDHKILPFLLQPIVENAVLHGLEGKVGRGNVSIRIFSQAEMMVIEINDNGEGIPPERLKEVQNSMETEAVQYGSSIGLSNISHRIRLHYGKPYGVKINSEIGVGTTVTLTVPLICI